MKISLSPIVSDKKLALSKAGDVLTINDEAFDFSVVPDGATLPAHATSCEFIIGDIERVNGDLQLTLMLPIGMQAGEAARFPQAIINPADGPIGLPE